MSEIYEPSPLEALHSGVLDAMAEYDDNKRILFGLVTDIANDLPDRVRYDNALAAHADDLAYSFGDLTAAMYQSYGVEGAKGLVATQWYIDDAERNTYLSELTSCDCIDSFDKQFIEDLVDDNIFSDAYDEDELRENARIAYKSYLLGDLEIFTGHVDNNRELMQKVSKAVAIAKVVVGISVSGLIASKFSRKGAA